MSENQANEYLYSEDILLTKLSPPRLHASLIPRPDLFARLAGAADRRLTLVTAPTGSGKTTLVSQWLQAAGVRAAWVTLDEGDNDPARFWRYVIQAFRRLDEGVGKSALAVLRMARQPSFPLLLTGFINELAQLQAPVFLVLDEVHLLTAPEVLDSLLFLIEHAPENIHVIALARKEPDWPVGLLRARGELNELHAADLRFSQGEIDAFLKALVPGPLPAGLARRLEEKTEGWAAGLRLVTQAMQGKNQPVEQVIETFNGEHRFVLAYLRKEVYEKQPEEVRSFLLRTCLLERLCGPLCDELLGGGGAASSGAVSSGAASGGGNSPGSAALLEELAQANLFIEPLGIIHRQSWYRYQALFAEAMRHEALQALGEASVLELHARASRWFERQGLLEEAIASALSAREDERAIALIERFIEQHTFYEVLILQRWYGRLPVELLRGHPLVALNFALALLFSYDRYAPATAAAIEPLLQSAENDWQSAGDTSGVGQVLAVRAVMTWWQGDTKSGFAYARRALECLPQSELIWRSTALLGLGNEAMQDGSLLDARNYLMEAQALSGAVQNIHGVLAAVNALGEVDYLQGKMDQAAAVFQQVLAEAVGGVEMLDDQSIAWLGLARIAYERNDLSAAAEQAARALDLGTQRSNEAVWVPAAVLLACIARARGDPAGGLAQLTALLTHAHQPLVLREVWLALARFTLDAGELSAARDWYGLAARQAEKPFASTREREDFLLARLLIAEGKPEQALDTVRRWKSAAQEQSRARSEIEALCLESEALASLMPTALAALPPAGVDGLSHAGGPLSAARSQPAQSLASALAEGQPAGFRRIFLDEGEPLARLLQSAAGSLPRRSLGLYATALLHSFPARPPERASGSGEAGGQVMLVEPLSAQEIRVLRMVAAGRTNPEIAEALVVSVNTVKTQVQSIYRKLNVNSREEARQAARELNLI